VAPEGAARKRKRRKRRELPDDEELFELHLFFHYYPGPREEKEK